VASELHKKKARSENILFQHLPPPWAGSSFEPAHQANRLFQSPECIAPNLFFPENDKRQAQSTMTHVSSISSTSCIAMQLIMMSVCHVGMVLGQQLAEGRGITSSCHSNIKSVLGNNPICDWKQSNIKSVLGNNPISSQRLETIQYQVSAWKQSNRLVLEGAGNKNNPPPADNSNHSKSRQRFSNHPLKRLVLTKKEKTRLSGTGNNTTPEPSQGLKPPIKPVGVGVGVDKQQQRSATGIFGDGTPASPVSCAQACACGCVSCVRSPAVFRTAWPAGMDWPVSVRSDTLRIRWSKTLRIRTRNHGVTPFMA
jgi:hypothetical protein